MKKTRKWLSDDELKRFQIESNDNPLLRALSNRKRVVGGLRQQLAR